MNRPTAPRMKSPASEFIESLRNGFLLGAAVLLMVWPPAQRAVPAPATPVAAPVSTPAPAIVAPPQVLAKAPDSAIEPLPPAPQPVRRLAEFGNEPASAEARHVAHWALYSGDHGERSVVVVDKKDARVFVFAPDGTLIGATPALLGSAHGDHTVPGVGDKPIAQVLPEERTTPAGRFIAQRGMNTNNEDVVWVDYDAAVSMHRVRANVKSERRLERLASATAADNRISYGCINLPKAFYEQVLSPAVQQHGAVIYVLPETRTPPEVFGSYDVPLANALAQR